MTDELKPLPCPFCGLPGQIHGDFNMEALSCSDRTGDCPGSWAALSCRTPPQRAEAIAAWNRRAQPATDKQQAAIDNAAAFARGHDAGWASHELHVSLQKADAAPSVAPEPLFLLHSGQMDSGGEQDDWETEADSQVRVDEFCRLHPGKTIPLFAHPPRAPLTEEIESADKLLRHLGLDPERCRTEGGSLNVSRIKTLLADAAPTARESAMEELLRSAAAIAQRHGAGTAWDRFGASIKALGIGAITARTYRLLPSDTERQQPPTTDPSRLADDLSNIGTMSPRIRKLYDDAAAFIRSTQAPLTPWQSMKTAPKDGTAVLVLLDASDIPHAARWLRGPDDARATEETTGAGWHLTWDGLPIAEHDGPRYWMHCPDDPDESDIEAAHGIGEKP